MAVVANRAALDQLCINTVRTLSMDAVQRANSGHPGAPMGLAPLCYVLWMRHLRHNPANPEWIGRDRFVLSCGHASMLLYSLLHLSGYDLPLEEIVSFRQWESRTPGHPEYGHTVGVETTTGPLGQGMGNAVGMAVAQAHLAQVFHRDGHDVLSHHTYFVASDGDIMEGVSHESASLAGHLRLGSLIGFYDDNRITIDGPTDLTLSDDTAQRFEAYGWHVQRVDDGNALDAIDAAILEAKGVVSRPSLIIVRTHIGFGSPNKQDTADAHGAPLGEEEVRLTKQRLGWTYDEPFTIPTEALSEWRTSVDRGAELEAEWKKAYADYEAAYPDLAAELQRRLSGALPPQWEDAVPRFDESTPAMATRNASGKVLNAIAQAVPELLGGSADLAGSNKTRLDGASDLGPATLDGRNIYFGVREHGMAAIMNGMALYGGIVPYGGTFLIFSDYMRPAVRLAAMMGLHVIYVYSHDSIGLGEDGPTHQPIETLSALRAIPNLVVIRPADGPETAEAWRRALKHRDGPVALSLTRQKVSMLPRDPSAPASELARGAYVLSDSEGEPDVILLASGSEVALILEAKTILDAEGVRSRVVSFPSHELFAAQPEWYRTEVLPPAVTARLAVEAGHPMSWYRWVGLKGDVVGIDRFGASAPWERLYAAYGFTAANIVRRAKALLG